MTCRWLGISFFLALFGSSLGTVCEGSDEKVWGFRYYTNDRKNCTFNVTKLTNREVMVVRIYLLTFYTNGHLYFNGDRFAKATDEIFKGDTTTCYVYSYPGANFTDDCLRVFNKTKNCRRKIIDKSQNNVTSYNLKQIILAYDILEPADCSYEEKACSEMTTSATTCAPQTICRDRTIEIVTVVVIFVCVICLILAVAFCLVTKSRKAKASPHSNIEESVQGHFHSLASPDYPDRRFDDGVYDFIDDKLPGGASKQQLNDGPPQKADSHVQPAASTSHSAVVPNVYANAANPALDDYEAVFYSAATEAVILPETTETKVNVLYDTRNPDEDSNSVHECYSDYNNPQENQINQCTGSQHHKFM